MKSFRFLAAGLFLLGMLFVFLPFGTVHAFQQKAYLFGDYHQPDPVNLPNQSWMRSQHDEVASLEANSTYGWAVPFPEATETTYSGTWTGRIEFESAPPSDYVIIYAFMSWDPDTNGTTLGPWGTITGDGAETIFNISVTGSVIVPAGDHLCFGLNNESLSTGYGWAEFDIITAQYGGTDQPSYVVKPGASETFYLYGDDHEPDPVNYPNQAWMRKPQDEVASLEADDTYGWAGPQPFYEETTLSGTWTGQLKFASAPPAGYVIAYGILSWDPETNDHVTALTGTIIGDGSKKIFDISLSGDITIPAGDHLAFGVNNETSATGYGGQAFDIVTFENGGTDQPSFLIMPIGVENPNLIAWGNNLVADFGDNGLWYYDSLSWNWLSNQGHVNLMVEWGSNLAVDFGQGRGIYFHDGTSWQWLSNWDDAANMAVWGDRLVVDFGSGRGIHFHDGVSWQWLSSWDDANGMAAWGDKLVVDFGQGRGMYTHDGSSWSWLANWDDANAMTVWGNNLTVDFGAGRGMYTHDGSSWSWLANWDGVNRMLVWGSDLVVDFGGGRGIYTHDTTGWQWLSNMDDVNRMVVWDGDLVVDFGGGRSIYAHDTTGWQWLSNWDDVAEMAPWFDGTEEKLGVDFGPGTGIYYKDGAGWHWTINWSTAD